MKKKRSIELATWFPQLGIVLGIQDATINENSYGPCFMWLFTN